MSYTTRLTMSACPHCGRGEDVIYGPDPTYNLTPIFDRALTGGSDLPNADTSEASVVLFCAETDRPRGLRLLSGRTAGETVEPITQALAYLKDPAHQAELTALEPDNGWGTLAGAVKVLDMLREFAEEHPRYTWEIM